jgi:hypothetical protein
MSRENVTKALSEALQLHQSARAEAEQAMLHMSDSELGMFKPFMQRALSFDNERFLANFIKYVATQPEAEIICK